MKKRKNPQSHRLVLNRETLRALEHKELLRIRGGQDSSVYTCSNCLGFSNIRFVC